MSQPSVVAPGCGEYHTELLNRPLLSIPDILASGTSEPGINGVFPYILGRISRALTFITRLVRCEKLVGEGPGV
jgi:hypothetical protein